MLLRRFVCAFVATGFVAGFAAPSAFAEESEAMTQQRRIKAEEEKRTDAAYRRSLGNIDNKQVNIDPWGDIRSAGQDSNASAGKTKKK